MNIRHFEIKDSNAVEQFWKEVFPDDPPHNAPTSVTTKQNSYITCMKKERADTIIGLIKVELYFSGCRTLKDRRGFLRSLKDRLSNMGFSVAQIGPPDIIQRAWIAAVCVSGTETGASRLLDSAEKLMYNPEWELISINKDIITDGELSEMEEHH